MMTQRRTIGIWVCLLLASALGGCNQEDRNEVRQVHAEWHQAFLDRDGERHYELLALPAQECYSRILNYALHATRKQVLESPPIERFQILLIRQMSTREELEKLDGKSFVTLYVNDGWFDPDNWPAETIRNIEFSGSDYATAELVLDGVGQEAQFGFIREDGQWKVDDTLLDPVFNQDIAAEAAYFEITENEVVIDWVEETSGEIMPDSLWDGPK